MSQGNDFANYAASDEASAASEDVWFVAVASDDIKQMTVDQLDEAFRLGVISAATQVWTEGMETWAPLGEVADLDGADASDSSSGSEDEEETSIARMDYDSPVQQVAAPSYASIAAQHSAVQTAQNGFASGPASYAPVTSSFAPTASSLSPAPLGLSSGPVALNVDEDMPAIRRGRRFRPERWLLAAAAIVGVGVTAYNNSDIFSSSVAVAETGKAAPTALAARPYEAGGGVERGASLGSAKSGADEDEPAPGETGADSKGTPSPAASAPMNDGKAEADDGAEPPASAAKAAPAKESLKGSFSKAFNKKAPAAKPRAAKARKTARRAATKPAKAPKKAGAPRAGSAFDPLNDSLP